LYLFAFWFPVAFTLAGVSIIFALITSFFGVFDLFLLETLPNRIFGVMTNSTLIAVPLFIFMGVLLEKSKVAEELCLKCLTFFLVLEAGLVFR
jgi:TRAP-type mannitol/chloroaromatic compound transport system permease large subunit